jgi:hypothetical protein
MAERIGRRCVLRRLAKQRGERVQGFAMIVARVGIDGDEAREGYRRQKVRIVIAVEI